MVDIVFEQWDRDERRQLVVQDSGGRPVLEFYNKKFDREPFAVLLPADAKALSKALTEWAERMNGNG